MSAAPHASPQISPIQHRGNGVPPLRSLVLTRGRRTLQLVGKGRVRTALHLLAATLADLGNFYLWRPADGSAQCPCCGWSGPAFLATWDWRAPTFQSRCPSCDSRSRHRGLETILGDLLRDKPEGPVLVFAPEPVALDQLRRIAPHERVLTASVREGQVDYPSEDPQRLSLPDASFALIVCNHVLPVVADDEQAVRECARVLKPGGTAVFTAPGNFRQEFGWYFPSANNGAGFRRYGMDLMSRLQRAFRRVEAVDLGRSAHPEWRVRRGDHAFLCTR